MKYSGVYRSNLFCTDFSKLRSPRTNSQINIQVHKTMLLLKIQGLNKEHGQKSFCDLQFVIAEEELM